MKIKIKLTDSQLRPVRNYLDDSGWDLKAGLLCSHVKIQPGDIFQCSSGLSIELPTGWEGQVRGRSSLNRLGIMVPTGTIDAGYRGEIGIIIYNLSKNMYIINKYDKIAQLIISPVFSPKIGFEEVELLEKTERNKQGFGSTGK